MSKNNDLTKSNLYGKVKYRFTDRNRLSNMKRKRVICVETKEQFDSILECSKSMSISAGLISKHLISPETKPNVKGFTFHYI